MKLYPMTQYYGEGFDPAYWIQDEGGNTFALCFSTEHSRMIASLPELLKACQSALDLIRESGFVSGLSEETFDNTMRQLGEAINKAK